jgi:hypothetical protein
MNESPPSYDRDRDAADSEKHRLRQAVERLEESYDWETAKEKARAEAADEPSADGDPDDGPTSDLSDGRDAAGAADQLAWILAAENDGDFVRRVFQDFEARLDELGCRIVVVVDDGHLDTGRRRALFNRILASSQFLIDVAGALEPDPDWYAR